MAYETFDWDDLDIVMRTAEDENDDFNGLSDVGWLPNSHPPSTLVEEDGPSSISIEKDHAPYSNPMLVPVGLAAYIRPTTCESANEEIVMKRLRFGSQRDSSLQLPIRAGHSSDDPDHRIH